MTSGLTTSVVIPTRDRKMDLRRCLESLMSQTVQPDEILVVDNGSTDGTADLLRGYQVRTIRVPRARLSAMFNLCWRRATGGVVVFLNDDTEVVPDWLARLQQTLDDWPQAAAVGGPTIAMREQVIQRVYRVTSESRWLRPLAHLYNEILHEGRLLDVGAYSESGAYSIGGSLRQCLKLEGSFPVDLLSITNAAIRRNCLEALGGFDESFLYAHIDGDFFLSARARGLSLVFDPTAIAWHYVNPAGLTRSAYVLGHDLAHLYRKHPPSRSSRGWLRFGANIALFNLFWIYSAAAQRRWEPLAGIRGFAAGAVGRSA